MEDESRSARQLWVDDEKGRQRMPDPVRTAAVRAVMITSVTLVQGVVAFYCTVAGSWLAFPMTVSSVASTVVATWSVLDVWITRQVWRQRNGVVSEPSSTARQLRRERRAEGRSQGRSQGRSEGRSQGRSEASPLSEAA
ncbi:hypothetical protein OG357_32980 [Streptomyces sp. NBC_01255]|uniref:hypothetical protein n=1 Tax=Streptomyces sp. NBC_01255 TaxID=2903798 RepID=UPI002E311E54|nr:hypothetical protein [Streptomyces sp. NBC_01255]